MKHVIALAVFVVAAIGLASGSTGSSGPIPVTSALTTHIAIQPSPPTVGRRVTITVSGSACNPVTIRVLFLGVRPYAVIDSSSGATPPDVTLTFVPPLRGIYQAEVVCGGTIVARVDFFVT